MEKFEKWRVEYSMDGSKWMLEVMAANEEDAKRRVGQAAAFGKVIGGEVFSVKIAPDWVPRLYARIRNAFA